MLKELQFWVSWGLVNLALLINPDLVFASNALLVSEGSIRLENVRGAVITNCFLYVRHPDKGDIIK